jgi:predicted dehydrogenase
MNMSLPVKKAGIGIIGCGYWGVNYVRVFNELPNAEVVAICDPRVERLQEVGARFPGSRLTTELHELLQMPEVEAVVVCTGATTHYEVARHALHAGKHILVEKPLAATVAEASDLGTLAQDQDLILMVGHTFLYNPGILKVKESINAGDMGQIYYLYSCRTNLGPIRHDVNALWDLAPHDISIFNFLLDSTPEWVSAVGAKLLRNSREDVGFISLGYQNNIIGNIHVSWADPSKVRRLVAVGSQSRVVFDDLNAMEPVRIYEKGIEPATAESDSLSFAEHQLLIRDGDIFSPQVQPSEPLKNQCSHFMDCISHGIRPRTGAKEGLAVVQVLSAIDRSIAQYGAPVEVTPVEARTTHAAPVYIHELGESRP